MSIEPVAKSTMLFAGHNGHESLIEKLLAASDALAAAPDADLTEKLRTVSEALIGLGGAECVDIYIWNDQRMRMTVGYEHTIPEWPRVNAPGTLLSVYAEGTALGELRPGSVVAIDTADISDSVERLRRERAGIGAALRLPIHADARLIGHLELFKRTPTWRPTAEEMATARVAAHNVAAIITAHRLTTNLIVEQQANRAVIATAQATGSQADPRGILRRIVRDVRETLASECVQIVVWYPRDGRVDVVAEAVGPTWPQPLPLPGVVGYHLDNWPSFSRMLDGDDHVLITPTDPACSEDERQHLRSRGIAATLAVRIHVDDEVVGAIIEQTTRADVGLIEHLPILRKIATVASIPARSARSARKRHLEDRRRALMQHLTSLIAVESHIEHLLEEATHGLIDATRADLCVTVLEGPDRERIASRSAIASHLKRTSLASLEISQWPATSRLGKNRRIVTICAEPDDTSETDAANLRAAGVSYGLLAAIHDGQASWGTIALFFPEDVDPNEFATQVLEDIVQLVAAAASRNHLLSDSTRKTADLELLLEGSRAAISGHDVEAVLQDIARLVVRHERFDTCAVDLLDGGTQDLRRLAFVAAPDHPYVGSPRGRSPFTVSNAAIEAMASHRPIAMLASDPTLSPAERERFATMQLGSIILAPLHIGAHAYGMLLVGSRSIQPFRERHFRFIEEIAAQSALAIDRARLIDALTARADHDGLTGLLNHRAIQERLDHLLEQANDEKRTISILMVDLDGFKLFNDTYGHLVGDRYLREAAGHMVAAIGDQGLLGRYGGDEFMAVLPNGGPDEAADCARAILERIRMAAFVIDDVRLPIQLSIGAATYPLQGRSRRALIERADTSMYVAKDAGGGRVVQFEHAPLSGGSGPFSVLSGLVQAVDRKDRYTRVHSDRVTALAVAMGRHLELGEEELEALYVAGQLHDVGKIAVPDNLLRRPGSVTREQNDIMQQHVGFSEMMIRDVPHFDLVMEAVSQHHERWDGSGYPRQLAGEQISLLGRVLAIADSVAAMTQDRPYLKARSWDYAVSEVRNNAGGQFDPTLAARLADFLEAIGEDGAPTPSPPPVLTAGSGGDPD